LTGVAGDDLYTELWKACAGPLVDVPKAGERVFYFPQGHMEQVCSFWFTFPGNILTSFLCFHCFKTLRSKSEPLPILFLVYGLFMQLEASTNQELNQQIPRFNLPPKILCRVVNIQLLVVLILVLLFHFYVFLARLSIILSY